MIKLTHPPTLNGASVYDIVPQSPPSDDIEITYDQHGIPHIEAGDERSLVYGLGFVHARDRLFQLHFKRMAAQGRLTELYGKSALDTDRQLRFLQYKLDEAVAALSPRDRTLIENYIAGTDAGAQHAGRSIEMFFLSEPWRPLQVSEVVAMMRLRAFQMAHDLSGELARARIKSRLSSNDERRALLLAGVPAKGNDVLRNARDTKSDETMPIENAEVQTQSVDPSLKASAQQRTKVDDDFAFLFARHASSAWVVDKTLSENAAPLLVNDPHGPHRAPSRYYLVHLKTRDGIDAIGATLPGDIGVALGFTKHLSWGESASFANTQDLIEVRLDPNDPKRYLKDRESFRFDTTVETFLAGGKPIVTERFRHTLEGPLLPEGYAHRLDAGHLYALSWTGFSSAATSQNVSANLDLLKARSIDDAKQSFWRMGIPSRNMLVATKNDIASILSGTLLQHDMKEVSLTNPDEGVLVSANQRLNEKDPLLGNHAKPHHRAQRIRELIRETLDEGKANADNLLAIQTDALSPEARNLSPIFASRCPSQVRGHSTQQVYNFCAVLKNFDGRFRKNTVGALVFSAFYQSLRDEVISTHLGPDVASQIADEPFIKSAIENALMLEHAGGVSPLFDDVNTTEHDGIDAFLNRAAINALGALSDEGLNSPADWRWSEVHTLEFRGPLSTMPLLSALFKDTPKAIAGTESAPMSEAGIPVSTGANVRMVVEMGQQPRGGLILDLGQSGHYQHEHFSDQYERWKNAEVIWMTFDDDTLQKNASGRLLIRSAPSP